MRITLDPRPGLLVALAALAAACGGSKAEPQPDAGPSLPPRICKTPGPTPAEWFADATAEVGLAATATFEPQAVSVIAADLDGDGWVDLLAQRGESVRGPVAGKQARFVLMNRPAPDDPQKRVFVDTSAEAGLGQTRDGAGDRGYGMVNIGDLNNDGSPDVILCPAEPFTNTEDVQDPCDAFLNDGKGHFTLAPASDLGSKVFWVPSAALFDYDRDGVLDFWPATVAHWPYPTTPTVPNHPPTLFRGNGDGTFVNVSKDVGLPTQDGNLASGKQWRHVFGVTVCDIDGDGDGDVLFADYGREENQVWRNDGGHFTNVAHELGLDYDDRMDFSDDQSYECYCQATMSCDPAPPAPVVPCDYFGNPYFRGWQPGYTDQPFSLGGNYFSFVCGDIDDDGDMDLMSATITHGDVGTSSDPSELILNPGDGSKWVRPGNDKTGLARPPALNAGVYWNHGDNSNVFADLDLDGKKDIFMTDTGAYGADSRSWLWRQKPDGTFEEITIASGLVDKSKKPDMQGPAFVDIDGDGDLDLVVGDVTGSPLRVYRNLVGQDQNWLRVKLVGKGQGFSNTSGIGARVRVTAGGRTQTLELQGGYAHGNIENDLVLTFGLGATCDVDQVEVRWPDGAGTVTTYKDVRANYTITLTEGEAEVGYPKGG